MAKRGVQASAKGRLPDLEGQMLMPFAQGPVNLYYDGAECPECGEPIEDDVEAGEECDGCGYVFHQ